MFKDAYKSAYNNIRPKEGCLDRIKKEAEKRRKTHTFRLIMRPLAALAITGMIGSAALPVMAREIPALYRILAKYAPALSEHILPDKLSCTDNGIVMQVEAVDVQHNAAEILLSFSNEEGSSLINGRVDLYDNYQLSSHGAVSNIGGCHFLEYDEKEGKAYFKIEVSTSDKFFHDKLTFKVSALLTKYDKETRDISLQDIDRNPSLKSVHPTGMGLGEKWNDIFQTYFEKSGDDLTKGNCHVLDTGADGEEMADTLAITGIAYADGILRVQSCRGNLADVDRHLRLFLADASGNEITEHSVDWRENNETITFSESWYGITEETLEGCQMYGIFYTSGGRTDGNWEVTFSLE